MSLKQEIETWVAALAAYDNNEFDVALRAFDHIADTSKILFNCGVIHATLGEHNKAVELYQKAIRLDQYLAVAYFQQGVSNFLMGDFEEALANFNDTLLWLRGNNNIDYEQLGLKFKLYSCEVLFNRGLCYIYLQQMEAGMQDLTFAAKEKVNPDHDVIDEAIREQAVGYTVFSIPVGIVYRPNAAKVKNLASKDYLGKARLVAAIDRSNAFTGFQGAEMRDRAMGVRDDRDMEKISYAATNLVKPNLRSRQQSEPPISRNVFPPTPPPEADAKPVVPVKDRQQQQQQQQPTSAKSIPNPQPLNLNAAGFEKPRLGNIRSASERPRGTRDRELERSRGSSDRAPTLQERRQQRHAPPDVIEDSTSPSQVYDMYHHRKNPSSNRIPYIQEEDEEAEAGADEDEYDDHYNEDDFEMINAAARRSQRSVDTTQRRRASNRSDAASISTAGGGGGGGHRTPRHRTSEHQVQLKVSKIRVKVHADDTRYVMISSGVEFRDFAEQIRNKFGLRRAFKIKMRDEEDFITMADQDDLDMAVQASKGEARKMRAEMGKMEVWLQEV